MTFHRVPPEVFRVIQQSKPSPRSLRRPRHRDRWSLAERRLELARVSRLAMPSRRIAPPVAP